MSAYVRVCLWLIKILDCKVRQGDEVVNRLIKRQTRDRQRDRQTQTERERERQRQADTAAETTEVHNFLVGRQDPSWQLSRDENLNGSGMSHATTASPKHPSGHLSRREGDAVVGRGMLDGQRQRLQTLSKPELLTKASCKERLEEDHCWIVPSVPPTTQSVKELNWTEWIKISCNWT